MSRRLTFATVAALSLAATSTSFAQSASTLYMWEGTGSIRDWIKGFGTNTVTLANTIPGELTITETGTAGSTVAISDGFNRVRESSTAGGGLDLTGLSSLQFDLGHNGSGPVNVQFYVQATPASTFVALGPDISVVPGINTYTLSLSPLTAAQQVYIRTIGLNIRDHAPLGNLTWTLQEVRSVGAGLTQRDLITHDTGTVEGGLQGVFANFDQAAILGNNGGQNQTGLTHNPAGSGSLQWTDVGGSNGAALGWGNGTAWNGNSFNNRVSDLSNYDTVTIRISATDPNSGGGTVNVQSYFQTGSGFTYQSAGDQALPIDGQFHDLTFPISALNDMDVVNWTGVNLGAHPQDLVMNVDLIRFNVIPEPGAALTLSAALLPLVRRRKRSQ